MEREERWHHTETARKITTGIPLRSVLERAWKFFRENYGKICMSDKMQNIPFLMLMYPSTTKSGRSA